MLLEFAAHDRESLNKSRDVLMRSNAAGVQDIRVLNLKSLQKSFLRAGLRPVIEEIRIGRAVDQAYPVRANPKKILDVTPGRS